MTVSVDLWQVLAALAGLLGAIGLGFVALGKVLLSQIAANLQLDVEALRKLERDMMMLRAELPEKYVRREDYIRGQTVIEAKLDAISSELKLVQIQGAKRAN